MIPDRIYGLNVKTACEIHDWMFREDGDFDTANEWFEHNLDVFIASGKQWKWLVRRRKSIAGIYISVVSGKIGRKYYEEIRQKDGIT